MGLADTLFHVATEFRFEVGSAIGNSDRLRNSVEQLSDAADHAMTTFQRLSMSIVGSLGLGEGSVIGALYGAVKAADKFRQSQIGIANLLNDGTTSFDERLEVAAMHMQKINEIASKFALPSDELLQLTKLTAPMLRSKLPGGKVGQPNFPLATDLSRMFLKAAPTLGIDVSVAMGEFQRMIMGGSTMHDTLFRRLAADTQSMHGMTSQKYNALPEQKRIALFSKALGEFSKDTAALEANVNTLNGQLVLLKNNIVGTFGVLADIGQSLLKMIVPALSEFNAYLQKQGHTIFKNLSSAIAPWMDGGWRKMIVNIMQLKELAGHFKLAAEILSMIGTIEFLHWILSTLRIQIPYISAALNSFSGVIKHFTRDLLNNSMSLAKSNMVAGMISGGGKMGMLGWFLKIADMVVVVVSEILIPILFLVGVFQLFARAAAIAKVNSWDNIAKALPIISKVVELWSRIWAMLMEGFDSLAEILAPLFKDVLIASIGTLAEWCRKLAVFTTLAIAGFEGLTLAMFEFVHQIKEFLTGNGFDTSKIGDAFDYGMNDVFERVFGKIKNGDAVANMTTNIGRVEINNAFKDQMEPDRIAFTIKEQILKAAINPQSGSGQMMRKGLVGA